MKARAVIGANFGDEGKGLFTDYLASQGGDVVVRFNGGCQAGHTVVTPSNQRHVFSHFGSGSFVGLPTFFSQHTIVNPVLFAKEQLAAYEYLGGAKMYVHPDALVTTPWDMNANQDNEKDRGLKKHGSCGVGIFQTIVRDREIPLRMRDLWDADLTDKIKDIMKGYGKSHDNPERFIDDCTFFSHYVEPADIAKFKDPIFEGAQGLMLCQSNMEMYPYLTPSRCGMTNVRELLYEGRFAPDACDTYYVSRTYLTRHGRGPLPNYDPKLDYEDNTNVHNSWQEFLRFGHLDVEALLRRVHADCQSAKLVFTHCDQASAPHSVGSFYSYGPTRDAVFSNTKGKYRWDGMKAKRDEAHQISISTSVASKPATDTAGSTVNKLR